MDVLVAKEIRLKHGAPVVATFIVDRNLYPLSETAPIKGGSDAESPAATGAHRLIVCSQQQIKVLMYIIVAKNNCSNFGFLQM